MTTELLHMEDDQTTRCQAVLREVGEDDSGTFWCFDRTVFYPQGGGQATDTGRVEWAEQAMTVSFVAEVEGQVRHYLAVSGGKLGPEVTPQLGTEVTLEVDLSRRRQHSALHTAGHLVQAILEELSPGWKAIKGYHFADSPYVEFEGMPSGDREELVRATNTRMAELLAKDLRLERRTETQSDGTLRRWVTIPGHSPVACAGTHLDSLGELQEVVLKKIKPKRGNGRANYACLLRAP